MISRAFAVAVGLTILSSAPLRAQNMGDLMEPRPGDEISRVGTRGANFLEIGVGARAMALGGAGAALEPELSALYWNTASIAGVESVALGLSSADLYGASGLSHTFGGVVLPVGDGAFGVSVSYFGAVVEWRGLAVGLHYALNVTDRLAIGAAGKYVEEGIDLAKANYLGLDVGATFDVGIYGLTLGAAVANLGTEGRFEGGLVSAYLPEDREAFPAAGDRTVRHDTRNMQLPTTLRFSVRSSLLGPPEALLGSNADHDFQAYAQVLDGIDTNIQTSLGLEYSFRRLFYVRGGKRFVNESQAPWEFADGLAGGLGVRIPLLDREFTLDYAYVSMGDLDKTQHISLAFGF